MQHFKDYMKRIESKIGKKQKNNRETNTRTSTKADMRDLEDYKEMKENVKQLEESLNSPTDKKLAPVHLPVRTNLNKQ